MTVFKMIIYQYFLSFSKFQFDVNPNQCDFLLPQVITHFNIWLLL